jgi:diguanylate cyclase (GGDEF)-like protein
MENVLFSSVAGVVHGLLLLDLDEFKQVNDTLGHQTGDALLIEVARRLQELAVEGVTLARLGGDEFAVLVADTTSVRLELLGEEVLAALAEPYRVGSASLGVTTSIGLRVIAEPTTPTIALRDADLALYAAKGAGRNRIAIHTGAPQLVS